MIGYLQGKIKDTWADKAVILTSSGVGYLVHTPGVGFLPDQEVEMYIYTGVRENDISLWGFNKAEDLKLFELLLEVSGIGLKTAFALVNNLGVSTVINAIRTAHVDSLKAPGVGRKTSERIVLELKDKIDNITWSVGSGTLQQPTIKPQHQQMIDDSISALEGLGYRRNEVELALKQIDISTYKDSQELVKALLIRV